MKRTNGQDKVIAAFVQGYQANGPKCSNPNMPVFQERIIRTDGKVVWSYRMPIAFRDRDGHYNVVAYKDGPTRTTKQQIMALEYELRQLPHRPPVFSVPLNDFNDRLDASGLVK